MRGDRAGREPCFPLLGILLAVFSFSWVASVQESVGRSARTSVFPEPLTSETAVSGSQKTREISTFRASFNRARDLPKESSGTGSLHTCDICDVMRG